MITPCAFYSTLVSEPSSSSHVHGADDGTHTGTPIEVQLLLDIIGFVNRGEVEREDSVDVFFEKAISMLPR